MTDCKMMTCQFRGSRCPSLEDVIFCEGMEAQERISMTPLERLKETYAQELDIDANRWIMAAIIAVSKGQNLREQLAILPKYYHPVNIIELCPPYREMQVGDYVQALCFEQAWTNQQQQAKESKPMPKVEKAGIRGIGFED